MDAGRRSGYSSCNGSIHTLWFSVSDLLPDTAPVAQLDRALPSGGRGRGFESLRARHVFNELRAINSYPPPAA